MAERKRADVVTVTRDPDQVAAEIANGLDQLLSYANRHRDDPNRRLAVELIEELVSLNAGKRAPGIASPDSRQWPAELHRDFGNLYSLVKAGAVYLRICELCGGWYWAKDKRQVIFKADACERGAAKVRAKASRVIERDRARKGRGVRTR